MRCRIPGRWMNDSVGKGRYTGLTVIGFRLRTTKFSARCIINLVNLWQRIFSISSACLILILTRIELMDGSMRTRSAGVREMISGFSRTSLELLRKGISVRIVHIVTAYATSTSGLLCRSTTWLGFSERCGSSQTMTKTWEEKFSRVRAAVNVALTAPR